MFPIYLSYILIVAFIGIAFELGYRISKHFHLKKNISETSTLGQISGGLLGMLAFVLAITFSVVSNHFNMRQKMVLEEANAIGTAYLRAELLTADQQSEMKVLLEEYVETRIQAVDKNTRKAGLERSVEIQGLLWNEARAALTNNPDENTALVVEAVNEVIDMHARRVAAGIQYSIPIVLWAVLILISTICMFALGLQSGFNRSRKLLAVVPLVIAFSALTMLIVDLNRPQEGFIKIGQDPIINLQHTMNKDA